MIEVELVVRVIGTDGKSALMSRIVHMPLIASGMDLYGVRRECEEGLPGEDSEDRVESIAWSAKIPDAVIAYLATDNRLGLCDAGEEEVSRHSLSQVIGREYREWEQVP